MPRSRGLVLAASLVLLCAAAARAEDITVNVFEDVPDADAFDGVCDANLSVDGLQCSLRAAIQHANATPGEDRIIVPAGLYRLRLRGDGENAGATGDLDITDDVLIEGAGAGETIVDAKKAKDRVFDVLGSARATISGLTLRSGKAPATESGGGVRCLGAETTVANCAILKCRAGDDAGGIDVQGGTVYVFDTWIDRCKAKDDGGAMDVDGGEVVIQRCAFTRNRAKSEGGGIENSGSFVSIQNSTISANKARGSGGISLEDGGVLGLDFCTIAKNKAKSGGGIDTSDIQFGTNTADAFATIFEKNRKGNCRGGLNSASYCVDSDGTCELSGRGNVSGASARLLKLANNGGPTPTHALRDDSPARDLVPSTEESCPDTDQRGTPRPSSCSAGAWQAELP